MDDCDEYCQLCVNVFKSGGRASLSYLSVYSLCLFCLLEQLDDLVVVASPSGNGQSGIATGVDLILLCSRGEEELHDLHMSIARSAYQGGPAIFIGFVHVSLHRKQCLHALHMAITSGHCQGRVEINVSLILVCSGCEKSF